MKSLRGAARDLGLQVHVLRASTEREIDDAFAVLSQLKAGGVVIGSDVFFNTRSEQLGALASRHGVAAIYQYRAFALAGGLMSYSGDIAESYRLAGVYTGQILKGEKPADLPVQQATKFELVINLKTAKALGLDHSAAAARPRRRGDRMRAARVHHAARRRGGRVAARGARAAAGEAADHRVPGREPRLRPGACWLPLSCSGCANSAGSRAAPSRSSIAGRRDAASASPRSRPSSSGSRSMSLSRRERCSPRGKAGDIGHPDRLRGGGGPGRQRLGRKSGATGRQRHRPVEPVDRSCRQATRTLARGCPRSSPVGDHGQCRQSRRRAGDGRGSGGGPHARPRGRHTRNPASRGYRARLRGAQGPRGGTLCLCRPARQPPTGFASTRWRSARDCRRCTAFGSTSKREV